MARWNNLMEIFKLLDKSNCRECYEPTCMAFAAAVFQGKKRLAECTHLDRETVACCSGEGSVVQEMEKEREAALEDLKKRIADVDLAAAAERLGGRFSDGRLTLKVLGKDFSVDRQGRLFSDIHVHAWIAAPFLNHILTSSGVPPSGRWLPLRELRGGKTWHRLFGQRCEAPLKQVADTYTELFEDMIHIFNGRQVENRYASDISLVLHPLPKVPLLICYWKAEEGLDSNLHLFFDDTAEAHLHIEALYALVAGLVRMFEKLAQRHGWR